MRHFDMNLDSDKAVKPLMCGSRGGDRGSGPPLKNQKNIGSLSNTGPDPLKNHKSICSKHSMLGHHRHTSETPFNGVSLAGR